jgi:hypothetical protein
MLLRLAYLPMGCCVASFAVITTRSEVVLSYRGSMGISVAMHGHAAKPFCFVFAYHNVHKSTSGQVPGWDIVALKCTFRHYDCV